MSLLHKIVDHPANKDLIAYIHSEFDEPFALETDWDEMRKRSWSIGTLPDAVDMLWIKFATKVPPSCRAIFMNRPVLLNPGSGEIFGFASGTDFPMVKLPADRLMQLKDSISASSLTEWDVVFESGRKVGVHWIYCGNYLGEFSSIFWDAYSATCE